MSHCPQGSARGSCWALLCALLLLTCSRQESTDEATTQPGTRAHSARSAPGSADEILAAQAAQANKSANKSANKIPDASEAAEAELRIGIAIPSYVHAVAWIAQDGGHLAVEGVRADISVTGGSAAAMRALLGGSIDVALAGGDAVLKASRAGADLVVVGTLVNRYYHRLIARQDIEQPEALKGKTIGLPFLGGPQDMAVQYALNKWGLTYNRDVKVASLGKQFNLLTSLTENEIQATTSDAPDSLLAELGLHSLLDLPNEPAAFPYLVVATERKTLEQRRPTLARLLRALCRATSFYKQARRTEGTQRTAVFQTLENRFRSKKSRALVERFEHFGPDLLRLPPTVERSGFQQVVALATETSQASLPESLPAKLFDPQLLTEAGGPCRPAGAPVAKP